MGIAQLRTLLVPLDGSSLAEQVLVPAIAIAHERSRLAHRGETRAIVQSLERLGRRIHPDLIMMATHARGGVSRARLRTARAARA